MQSELVLVLAFALVLGVVLVLVQVLVLVLVLVQVLGVVLVLVQVLGVGDWIVGISSMGCSEHMLGTTIKIAGGAPGAIDADEIRLDYLKADKPLMCYSLRQAPGANDAAAHKRHLSTTVHRPQVLD